MFILKIVKKLHTMDLNFSALEASVFSGFFFPAGSTLASNYFLRLAISFDISSNSLFAY